MKGKFKQTSRKKKANAVLQKYKVAVDDFVKSKSASEDVAHCSDFKYVKKKSRKELRKEKRKLKKAKMKSHYEGKKDLTPLPAIQNSPVKEKVVPKKNKSASQNKNAPDNSAGKVSVKKQKRSKSSTTQTEKKTNVLQESRKQALLEANEQEDREIKKLERSLGLNKRKNKKTLPQSFVADGLDYILGVLDSGSSGAAIFDSEDDMDLAKDNFSKLEEEESASSNDDDEEEHKTSSDEDHTSESMDDENDGHVDSLIEDMSGEEGIVESKGDLSESDGEVEHESVASEVEDEDDAVEAQMVEESTEVE